MYKSIAAISITAAALMFAAAPAIADDDFAGPQDAQCGHSLAGLFKLRSPFLAKFVGECADTDDMHTAHLVD
jgi:hypothetical protein